MKSEGRESLGTHVKEVGVTVPLRMAMIGCGAMARFHLQSMLLRPELVQVPVVSDPSPLAYQAVEAMFAALDRPAPPNQPDLGCLLRDYAGRLDAAFIITPHVFHHDQTLACLEGGLDVLLEKPMVMNVAEAVSLIKGRDRTGRLLVVAFPGSLSPQIRMAAKLLHSGELGPILNISATTWQNWGQAQEGTWRQQPELSGGGFLFDTGAHMLNTVADLAGEEIVEVAAWLENRSRPVDTLAVVIARLASGALITMNSCGETIPSCDSDVRVFCTGAILRTGIWGERLQLQRYGRQRLRNVRVPPTAGVWEQFLAVRNGEMANPCPPEAGLRMARLWDTIKASAAQGAKVLPST